MKTEYTYKCGSDLGWKAYSLSAPGSMWTFEKPVDSGLGVGIMCRFAEYVIPSCCHEKPHAGCCCFCLLADLSKIVSERLLLWGSGFFAMDMGYALLLVQCDGWAW